MTEIKALVHLFSFLHIYCLVLKVNRFSTEHFQNCYHIDFNFVVQLQRFNFVVRFTEDSVLIRNYDIQEPTIVWLRKLKKGLCDNLEGWGGEGGGRRFKKEGICTPVADPCLNLAENNKIL